MVDKDMETLDHMTKENKTFTHMSGKTQTKEEFFSEIEDGTLNYYAYYIKDPVVVIDGNYANLKASTTLTAKVYGSSGTWTLNTDAWFEKINGEWIQCNEPDKFIGSQ